MMQMNAEIEECDQEKLLQMFSNASIDAVKYYPLMERSCRGRHKRIDVDQKIRLMFGEEARTMTRYGELVRALIKDQLRWIADRSHQRCITETTAGNRYGWR
jgi:uncharacterized protein YfbU (UPF0304 family)